MLFSRISQARPAGHAPSIRHIKRATLGLAFLIALAWCSTARGDIEVKPAYEPHEPIVATVTVTDVPAGAKLRGSLQVSDGSYLVAGENVFHIWAKPGKHTVKASGVWVLTQDLKVGDQVVPVLVDFGQYNYERSFTVGGENPPNPPDPPTPGGPYQVAIFYDADQLDNLPADQRALLTSLTYRQKLKEQGHVVLGVFAAQSISQVPSKFKAFIDSVAADPLPRLAVASVKGGKVVDVPLPATFAELEQLLSKEVSP